MGSIDDKKNKENIQGIFDFLSRSFPEYSRDIKKLSQSVSIQTPIKTPSPTDKKFQKLAEQNAKQVSKVLASGGNVFQKQEAVRRQQFYAKITKNWPTLTKAITTIKEVSSATSMAFSRIKSTWQSQFNRIFGQVTDAFAPIIETSSAILEWFKGTGKSILHGFKNIFKKDEFEGLNDTIEDSADKIVKAIDKTSKITNNLKTSRIGVSKAGKVYMIAPETADRSKILRWEVIKERFKQKFIRPKEEGTPYESVWKRITGLFANVQGGRKKEGGGEVWTKAESVFNLTKIAGILKNVFSKIATVFKLLLVTLVGAKIAWYLLPEKVRKTLEDNFKSIGKTILNNLPETLRKPIENFIKEPFKTLGAALGEILISSTKTFFSSLWSVTKGLASSWWEAFTKGSDGFWQKLIFVLGSTLAVPMLAKLPLIGIPFAIINTLLKLLGTRIGLILGIFTRAESGLVKFAGIGKIAEKLTGTFGRISKYFGDLSGFLSSSSLSMSGIVRAGDSVGKISKSANFFARVLEKGSKFLSLLFKGPLFKVFAKLSGVLTVITEVFDLFKDITAITKGKMPVINALLKRIPSIVAAIIGGLVGGPVGALVGWGLGSLVGGPIMKFLTGKDFERPEEPIKKLDEAAENISDAAGKLDDTTKKIQKQYDSWRITAEGIFIPGTGEKKDPEKAFAEVLRHQDELLYTSTKKLSTLEKGIVTWTELQKQKQTPVWDTIKNVGSTTKGFVTKTLEGVRSGSSRTDKIGGSSSWRTNNPGNIKATGKSGWVKSMPGYLGMDKRGHAIFDTEEHGRQAHERVLFTGKWANKKLSEMVKEYAEDNKGYAKFVMKYGNVTDKLMSEYTSEEQKRVQMAFQRKEGWIPGQLISTAYAKNQIPTAATEKVLASNVPAIKEAEKNRALAKRSSELEQKTNQVDEQKPNVTVNTTTQANVSNVQSQTGGYPEFGESKFEFWMPLWGVKVLV